MRARTRTERRIELVAALALALAATACGADSGTDAEATSAASGFASSLREGPRRMDVRGLPIGRRIPDLAYVDLADLDGAEARLSDHADALALAIVFREHECPVSKRIGRETRRLEQEFGERGVSFLYVAPNAFEAEEAARADREAFGFEAPYALDSGGAFVRALRAETTTDVFVLDRSRTLVYRGAIDDRVGRGYQREEARFEYLRDALEAVLAGEDVIVEATTAPGCFLGVDHPPEDLEFGSGEVTWHDQVHRIVQRRCLACHREGGAAPFPLEDRGDLLRRDGMVEFVVEERLMPPWSTSDDTGPWANDMRLSDWEREALVAWILDGMPEGDPADAPQPRSFPTDWGIGAPDLVFPMAEAQVVPAEGEGSNRPIPCVGEIEEDIWVSGIELRPSAPEVVHHTLVMVKYPDGWGDLSRVTDRGLVAWKGPISDWEFLIGYLPGSRPVEYPAGIARFLPKGTRFLLYTHYNPSGVEATDRSELGLVLADRPPAYVARSRLVEKRELSIPPHASGVVYDLEVRFDEPRVVTSIKPHMHYRGKEFLVELYLPDGTRRPLVDIREWDQDWQFTYEFLNDLQVPAGSEIRARAVFDNSASNPVNPDPSQHVTWGDLTKDEMLMMMIDWLEPVPAGGLGSDAAW